MVWLQHSLDRSSSVIRDKLLLNVTNQVVFFFVHVLLIFAKCHKVVSFIIFDKYQ